MRRWDDFDEDFFDTDLVFLDDAGEDEKEEDDDDYSWLPETMPSISPSQMDTILREQHARLSSEVKAQIHRDMNGQYKAFDETQEFVQRCLDEMDSHLDELGESPALDAAVLMDESYVNNPEFRLRFLRSEFFQPQKAAKRLALHFQVKLELFGRGLLCQDITQDDLDADTLEALYLGYSQFLPIRDATGRLVHVQFVVPSCVSLQSKLKLDFYYALVKSQDSNTQQQGCVGIRFYNGQWLQKQPKNVHWQAPRLLLSLPFRPSAMHLCHDSKSVWSPIFALMKYVMGSVIRSRTVEHYGTHEQCLQDLKEYGIVVDDDAFPLKDGQIVTNHHEKVWKQRREFERQQRCRSQQSSVSVPRENPFAVCGQYDVLIGRGKRYYQHVGNIRFRCLVEGYRGEYDATASTTEKKRITSDIVRTIHKMGGRFLKENHDGWTTVSPSQARLKVSHVFRNMRATPKRSKDEARLHEETASQRFLS